MSVNFGGNPPLDPTPRQGDGDPPQPPQQPQMAGPNAPRLEAHANPNSSSEAMALAGEILQSTEPALSASTSSRSNATTTSPTPATVLNAMEREDLAVLNQMLDQGLDVDMSIAGSTLLECAMRYLSDPAILNRMLGLFSAEARQNLASHLYASAVMTGNGVGIEALLRWGVPAGRQLSVHVSNCCRHSLEKGPACRLAASLRLMARHCPDQDLLRGVLLPTLLSKLDLDRLKVVVAAFDPDLQRNEEVIGRLLGKATECQRVEFATTLIAWLRNSGAFAGRAGDMPLKATVLGMNDDQLLCLAKAAYPFSQESCALPRDDSRASEFQKILLGEGLERSAVAKLMNSANPDPKRLIRLVLKCYSTAWVEGSWELDRQKTEYALFFAGFRKPLLAPIADTMKPLDPSMGNQNSGAVFMLCSLLNELRANEALKTANDPLLGSQLHAIKDAVAETLQSLLGEPVAFFSATFTGLSLDSGADRSKLTRIFLDHKGLPELIVTNLVSLVSQSFERHVDQNLTLQFDSQMTVRQAQLMMKKQVLVNMLKALLTELPAALQSHALVAEAGKRGLLTQERTAMHVAITLLSQYCEQMKADMDTTTSRAWDAYLLLSAGAFEDANNISLSDSELQGRDSSSDDERSS